MIEKKTTILTGLDRTDNTIIIKIDMMDFFNMQEDSYINSLIKARESLMNTLLEDSSMGIFKRNLN